MLRQEIFGHSHHAREETLCLAPESQALNLTTSWMSMDQRAGVWPVVEGGSSSSSGPAVPEDVEEGEPVKKLVAPTAPTASDREEHTASGHAVFSSWCRECCIGRGRMHQHRARGRDTTIPAIAIDYGYLNERGSADFECNCLLSCAVDRNSCGVRVSDRR